MVAPNSTIFGMTSTFANNPDELWRRGLGGVLDFACATHGRAILCLVVLSLIAFLPGFARMPVVDRDEARFAQASKQMMASGDYIDIRFQDDVRYKKPVGIYWMQVAAVKAWSLLGRKQAETRISSYRVPSLFGAIGAVLLTYWVALTFVSRRAAVLAAVMMAACILLGVEARLAKTDAVLLFTILAAIGAMARVYLDRFDGWTGWRRSLLLPLIFWGALGLGVLVKGPLILVFVGLPALTLCILDRSVRWMTGLNPLVGVPVFLLIVLPWFIAIYLRSGGTFFAQSAGEDMLSKVFSGQEGHGAPPGYYFVLFFLTFWPASLLAGLATSTVWRARAEAPVKFLLAWLVPTWIVFELVITKLPHYVLPLYPAIAILLAGCIDTHRLSRTRWMEYGTFWWFAVPAVLSVLGVVLLLRYEGELGWRAWPFLAASVVFGLRAWWLYEVDGPERSMLRACAASILLAMGTFWGVLPALNSLFPSEQVARFVHATECPSPQTATAGFGEPSVVFTLGTNTLLTDAVGAANFLMNGNCRFVLIDAHQDRQFARRAEALGLRYDKGPRFSGYSIGSGARVIFTIYYRGRER
jgi:4-amino-4-deoxy-L-arabinose transferase-like glycosyltransferase